MAEIKVEMKLIRSGAKVYDGNKTFTVLRVHSIDVGSDGKLNVTYEVIENDVVHLLAEDDIISYDSEDRQVPIYTIHKYEIRHGEVVLSVAFLIRTNNKSVENYLVYAPYYKMCLNLKMFGKPLKGFVLYSNTLSFVEAGDALYGALNDAIRKKENELETLRRMRG